MAKVAIATVVRRRPGRPGHIARAARDLGVERTHLWRVARGERPSRRLMGLYAAWRRAHGV
jgi:hypothetical protein